MVNKKFIIFDVLFLLFAILTYGFSFAISLFFGKLLWSEQLLIQGLIIASSGVIYIYSFVLILGFLRLVFQPKLVEGQIPIGMNKDYLAWGLNSIFCGIFLTSPIHQIGSIIFSVNYLYYRLMGMQLTFDTLIGIQTSIRQPELISIGRKSIVGLGAIMSCHFSGNGKVHTQKSIKIGEECVIGGFSIIAPGFICGNKSTIGASTTIYPDVTLGNKVKIGGNAIIETGVKIEDGAVIKSNSLVKRGTIINSNEVWEGSPAIKVN